MFLGAPRSQGRHGDAHRTRTERALSAHKPRATVSSGPQPWAVVGSFTAGSDPSRWHISCTLAASQEIPMDAKRERISDGRIARRNFTGIASAVVGASLFVTPRLALARPAPA